MVFILTTGEDLVSWALLEGLMFKGGQCVCSGGGGASKVPFMCPGRLPLAIMEAQTGRWKREGNVVCVLRCFSDDTSVESRR